MKYLFFIGFILLLLSAQDVEAQAPPTANAETPDYIVEMEGWETAKALAKKENKLIFIDLYFTGCFPCAQMDREVFPHPLIKSTLEEHFIPLKSDVYKETVGADIIEKYFVRGFPTFLILSADGLLIDRFSGYKDVGILDEHLQDALVKHQENRYYRGYSGDLEIGLPQMYHDIYNLKDPKPLDSAKANDWIKTNYENHPEAAAMLFLALQNTDDEVEQEFLDHYSGYASLYGASQTVTKAGGILNKRLHASVSESNDTDLTSFLRLYQGKFGAEDWAIIKQLLANSYFNGIKKDTTGYLTFMAENPIIYMNYYGAYYSNLLAYKRLTPERAALMATWGKRAIDENAPLDIMGTVASLLGEVGKIDEQKEVLQMIIRKGKKYQMDVKRYEKLLKEI